MFGVKREGNRIFVVIRMGRKPLGIFRHRWDDDIEVALKEKNEVGTLNGLVCQRIETNGGLFWAR